MIYHDGRDWIIEQRGEDYWSFPLDAEEWTQGLPQDLTVEDIESRWQTIASERILKMRHRVRLPLRCPVIFASDEFIGEGTVLNLGVPGCAVESDIAPLPGDYVGLHVLMPDEAGPLQVALAKVRWAKQQRFGVEFLKVSNGQQVRVGRLFRALQAVPSA
jgi:hypothetical protein